MAHNLSINSNGQHEMFCTGNRESAWHKLGQRSLSCVTWDEAMTLSNLKWCVEKKNFINPYTYTEVPNMYGTFRVDNGVCLGMVGEKYTPIQNNRLGEVLDVLVNNIGGAHYESAGAINNGSQVWALVNLKNQIKVGDDITENYLMFTNSHDGKSSATVKLTSTRVVCQNTLTQALKGSGSFFRIGHYPNTESRIKEVTDTINNINSQIYNLNDLFNVMANRQITLNELNELLNVLYPIKGEDESTQNKTKKDKIIELFETADNNTFSNQRGTVYNALNAVTEFVDHHVHTRGDQSISRATSALFGLGESLKWIALTELTKLVSSKSVV